MSKKSVGVFTDQEVYLFYRPSDLFAHIRVRMSHIYVEVIHYKVRDRNNRRYR